MCIHVLCCFVFINGFALYDINPLFYYTFFRPQKFEAANAAFVILNLISFFLSIITFTVYNRFISFSQEMAKLLHLTSSLD